MTDCSNALRDLLPEYLHQRLSAADVSLVAQHVAACADCSGELALLQAALAVRPREVPVDVAAIVAALPKSGASELETVVADPKVRALSSARSLTKGTAGVAGGWRHWRAAAAVAVIALGGASVAIARHGSIAYTPTANSNDSAETVAAATVASVNANAELATAQSSTDSGHGALPIGELTDYSDAEIESVIERLDKWDGATATEPLPGVPLLPVAAGMIP